MTPVLISDHAGTPIIDAGDLDYDYDGQPTMTDSGLRWVADLVIEGLCKVGPLSYRPPRPVAVFDDGWRCPDCGELVGYQEQVPHTWEQSSSGPDVLMLDGSFDWHGDAGDAAPGECCSSCLVPLRLPEGVELGWW